MLDIILKLSPIFLFFGLGVFIRRIGFANTVHGEFLLKFIFFISLPAMLLLIISTVPISPEKYYLPVIGILINVFCLGLTLLLTRFMNIKRLMLGSMLLCTAVMNNMVLYPFILYGIEADALLDLALVDFGNGITTATISYGIALAYGNKGSSIYAVVIKLVSSPLTWALIIGILLNIYSIVLPKLVISFLEPLGNMASPLILITLGIFFSPKLKNFRYVSTTILIRSAFGLLVGICLAKLFGFTGQTFTVIAISAAAPIGFTALAFSSIGKLDMEFTASAVSLSILLAMFYVPILLYLFQ